ncbi:hypothetical protein DAEQUDRAFT_35803 [Daedalea quercina L-15889]|uniref:Uncharacterized protein n=1 Tax=Daedalea quercina L-15889 TaxID=1314783 RepID=A0A165ST00_9APHY|nr:hypothetical protein DAEQUDRAFT_35803 [Daedalea quercina L-15889]
MLYESYTLVRTLLSDHCGAWISTSACTGLLIALPASPVGGSSLASLRVLVQSYLPVIQYISMRGWATRCPSNQRSTITWFHGTCVLSMSTSLTEHPLTLAFGPSRVTRLNHECSTEVDLRISGLPWFFPRLSLVTPRHCYRSSHEFSVRRTHHRRR